MSWWGWALVAWLLASVAFAVFVARFIAVGRLDRRAPVEDEIVIDLTGPEPTINGYRVPGAPVVPVPDDTAPGSAPARSV